MFLGDLSYQHCCIHVKRLKKQQESVLTRTPSCKSTLGSVWCSSEQYRCKLANNVSKLAFKFAAIQQDVKPETLFKITFKVHNSWYLSVIPAVSADGRFTCHRAKTGIVHPKCSYFCIEDEPQCVHNFWRQSPLPLSGDQLWTFQSSSDWCVRVRVHQCSFDDANRFSKVSCDKKHSSERLTTVWQKLRTLNLTV